MIGLAEVSIFDDTVIINRSWDFNLDPSTSIMLNIWFKLFLHLASSSTTAFSRQSFSESFLKRIIKKIEQQTEAYPEPCQTSKIECFTEIQ